jgi:hypothetical protein
MAPGGCSAAGAVSLTVLVSDMIMLLSVVITPVESVLVFWPLPQAVVKHIPEKTAITNR